MVQENELNREIKEAVKREGRYGWVNYIAAYFVAILALVGSIVASLLAALEVEKSITAVVAAIPAAVLALTRIFNFERRAFFHWRKYWRFRGLLRQLRDEGAEAKAVSQEFSKIDEGMLNEWIPFGIGDAERSEAVSTESAPKERR